MSESKNNTGGWRNNKWIRAAIPALLLHCSIGTVYCWSIFSQEIADYIGFTKGATEWAFSFAIFFLGMSAAFLGNIVEKDIHKSSLIAAICFAAGMAGTVFFIYYGGTHQGSMLALIGIYICYGFIMGNISAIHGITLSAWTFAGLTGNQMANWIVNKFGEPVTLHGVEVNPTGYQCVLYATIALYIVAFIISMVLVRPTDKALAAKQAKKEAK